MAKIKTKIEKVEETPAEKPVEAPKPNIINKVRYYCQGCTGRVMYAPAPFQFDHAVCPDCGKEHTASNYKAENWLPMSLEEIANQ